MPVWSSLSTTYRFGSSPQWNSGGTSGILPPAVPSGSMASEAVSSASSSCEAFGLGDRGLVLRDPIAGARKANVERGEAHGARIGLDVTEGQIAIRVDADRQLRFSG